MRRKWLIVAAVIAVAGAGFGWWLWRRCSRPRMPIGQLIGLRAVDADSAIGVWQGADHEWIGRLDAHGHLVWWHELPGKVQSSGVVAGLAIGGGVVTLRYARTKPSGHDDAVTAYALDDGRPLWDTALAADLEGPGSYLSHDLPARIDGDRLFEWVVYAFPARRYVLDVHTGGFVSSVEGGSPNAEGAEVIGDRVFERSDGWKIGVSDFATHAYSEMTAGPGCVIGSEYVTLLYDDEPNSGPGTLVAFADGDLAARRDLVTHFQPVADLARFSFAGCGRYRDRLVLSLQRMDTKSRQVAYVVITDLRGAVLHVLTLPELVGWQVQTSPLQGSLPRFVAYQDELGLFGLDLETGSLAWRGQLPANQLRRGTFVVGDRSYVALQSIDAKDSLFAFDGATGKLVAAISSNSILSGLAVVDGDIRPQIAQGTLWLWAEFVRTRLDEAHLAVLDARTLQPRFVRHVELTDRTAELGRAIGLH